MSGHSKWSTIKRKKGAADAKRGVIFTQVSKDITLAARDGGGDISMNANLRLAVKKAKAANMPNDNIDRAIKKGTGELESDTLIETTYEGYGPGGGAVLVEVLTDNKNRAVSEIRRAFSKFGGNLGESGCVAWIFEKKGRIEIALKETDEDSLFDSALDLGAEDIINEEDFFSVFTLLDNFEDVKKGLQSKGFNISSSEISMIPSNSVKIEGKPAEHMLKMLEMLEDCDDVQYVYSNFDIDDSVIKAFA